MNNVMNKLIVCTEGRLNSDKKSDALKVWFDKRFKYATDLKKRFFQSAAKNHPLILERGYFTCLADFSFKIVKKHL